MHPESPPPCRARRAGSRWVVVAVTVWSAGCTPGEALDDDSFSGRDETGTTDDASGDDTTPADDDSTVPTDDTTADDDATAADDDTTPPPTDDVVALTLAPGDIAVDVLTPYDLVALATLASGRQVELVPDAFSSDDEGVAVVDGAGKVTPVADGDTLVRASVEAIEAAARVRVVPAGAVSVTVVDAATGSPVEGATAQIGGTASPLASATTDGAGTALLEGAFAGRLAVHVTHEGHVRTSLVGAAARDQRIPVRPNPDPAEAWGEVTGAFVWPEGMGGVSDLAIGLTVAGAPGNPVLYDLGGLLGPSSEIILHGLPVDLPGNVSIAGSIETYSVPAPAGAASLWSLAGELPLTDAVDIAAADPEDQMPLVLSALADLLPEMTWGTVTGLGVPESAALEGVAVAPAVLLSESVPAMVPLNPVGTAPEDVPVALVLVSAGDAWLLAGLAVGTGTVDLRYADPVGWPGGAELRYIAVAEEGGISAGGDVSVVRGDFDVTAGQVTFDAFLDIPSLTPPLLVTDWTWAWSAIAGADLTSARLKAREGDWDIYCSGGADSFALEDVTPRLGMDQVRWYLQAAAIRGGSFDSLTAASGGGLPLEAWADGAERQTRSWLFYHAEPGEGG